MAVNDEAIFRVFRRVDRLLREVRRNPEAERVHRFRTAARRLDVVLELLRRSHPRTVRRIAKPVGRLRRRAGKVRDLDVLAAALAALHCESEAARRLAALIAERRDLQRLRLQAALERRGAQKLRHRLRQFARAIASRPVENAPSRQVAPVESSLREFCRVARRMPRTEAALHAYRIRCKHVRYLMELGRPDRTATASLVPLRAMQDALGSWHDHAELTRLAEGMPEAPGRGALLAELRNLTQAKLAQALRVTADARGRLLRRAARVTARAAAAPVRRGPTAVAVRPQGRKAVAGGG